MASGEGSLDRDGSRKAATGYVPPISVLEVPSYLLWLLGGHAKNLPVTTEQKSIWSQASFHTWPQINVGSYSGVDTGSEALGSSHSGERSTLLFF